MRKPEQKKIEPSIEEILASIRKIIAEDGLPENAPEGSYEQTDLDFNGPYSVSQEYDFGSFGGNNEISQEVYAPVRDEHVNGSNVDRAAPFPQQKMSSQEYDQTSDEDLIYIDDAEVSEAHEFDDIAYSQSAPFQKESFNPNAYYQALGERFATVEDEILELTEDFMIEEPNDDRSPVELDFSVVVSQIATISASKTHNREEFFHEVTEASPSLITESEEDIEVELLSDPEPEPDTAKQEPHPTATASEGEKSTSALEVFPPIEKLNDALASVVAEMRRLSEGQISKIEIEDTPIVSPSEQELSDDSAVSQPITFNGETTTPQRPIWSARCLDHNDNQEGSTDATEDAIPAQLTEPKSTDATPSHLSIAEEIMAMGNPMALAMEMSHFPNFNDKRVAQEERESEMLAPPVPSNTSLARHAKLKNPVEPPSAFALPEIEEEEQPQDFCEKPQCQTIAEPPKVTPASPIKKNCQTAEDIQDSPRANLEEVSNIANAAALPQSVEEKAPAMPATNSLKAEVSKIDTPAATELEAKVREILKPLFQEWLDEKLPHILSRVIADLQKPDA